MQADLSVTPVYTADLINILKDVYTDKFIINESEVGTPDYWKKAGIIELIRILENNIRKV